MQSKELEQLANQLSKRHFKCLKSKAIVITKSDVKKSCLVLGEAFYNFERAKLKSHVKRGKNFQKDIISDLIPEGLFLKPAKINFIKRLLELQFGYV